MPNFDIENKLSGPVAGVDEAGRGPLAGPVVGAALIFTGRNSDYLETLNDSKKLTAKKRDELFGYLTSDPEVCYDYAIIGPEVIDEVNIFNATKQAMKLAVERLKIRPDHVLVDGNHKMIEREGVMPVIKGDGISTSIAAASIIAKVVRDRIMQELDQEFPEYGWVKNAGYGTKIHLEALEQHGATIHHRRSFEPIKSKFA